jgi:hypothetical protein
MALSSQRQDVPGSDILPPELRQEIFIYLDGDDASLFAVIQVSKAFYHDSIGMLWHNSTQKRLARVPALDRRRHYANMVYRLEIDDSSSRKLIDGLDFLLLKDLILSGGSVSLGQFHRYFQAGLYTLQCIRSRFTSAMLETMATHCMQLQRLTIIAPDMSKITPGQFTAFLQNLPALRRLELEETGRTIANRVFEMEGSSVAQLEELSWHRVVFSKREFALLAGLLKRCINLRKLYLETGDMLLLDVLIQAMSHPSLEVFHTDNWLENEQLRQRFLGGSSVPNPFPSIKDLSIGGEASTIKAVLSSSPKTLLKLELDIDDNSDSILPTISRLSNLVHLQIAFDGHRTFSPTDLEHISKLSSLQKCHVIWSSPETTQGEERLSNDCPWLTDEFFKGWISKLPKLRDLSLSFNSATITQASLQFLADSCPSLLKCELMWEHDLSTWTSLEPPLFPHLECLRLGNVKDHVIAGSQATFYKTALRDVEVMRSLAPHLKRFHVDDSPMTRYYTNVRPPYETALKAVFDAGT